eukprot:GCRY01003704.1.p1 GENE.GCRY01003704.1~~GCRY01003704.1.p1  ORF type:complete len:2174 (-),score=503.42 GCRY01003704.1:287-6808(-)
MKAIAVAALLCFGVLPWVAVGLIRVNTEVLLITTTWPMGYTGFAGNSLGDNCKQMLQAFGIPYVQLNVLNETGFKIPANFDLEYVDEDGIPHGRYFGIVVQTDTLSYLNPETGDYESALTAEEWNQIEAYQEKFGVKRVIFFSEARSMPCANFTGYASDDAVVNFSSNALKYMAGLQPDVTINNGIYAFRGVASLMASPEGDSCVVLAQMKNNPAEMIMTEETKASGVQLLHIFSDTPAFDENPFSRVIGVVWVHWLTDMVYVGSRRVLLATHIDDLFLGTFLYDPAIEAVGGATYRVNEFDLNIMIKEQDEVNARIPGSNWRVEHAYNGLGVWVNGGPGVDELFEYCRTILDKFYWLTHTFTHTLLDDITYEQVLWEIEENEKLAIDLFNLTDPDSPVAQYWSSHSIVTPGISGLFTGHSLEALMDKGISGAVGDDNTKYFPPYSSYYGTETTVDRHGAEGFFFIPRFSTRVDYDTSLPHEVLGGNQQRSGATFTTFEELLEAEALFTGNMLLSYRHDPYMFHQANLRAFLYDHDKNNTTEDIYVTLVSIWTRRALEYYSQFSTLPVLCEDMDSLVATYKERMARDKCGVSGYLEKNAAFTPPLSFSMTAEKKCRVGVTGINKELLHTGGRADMSIEEYGPDVTLWILTDGNPSTLYTVPLQEVVRTLNYAYSKFQAEFPPAVPGEPLDLTLTLVDQYKTLLKVPGAVVTVQIEYEFQNSSSPLILLNSPMTETDISDDVWYWNVTFTPPFSGKYTVRAYYTNPTLGISSTLLGAAEGTRYLTVKENLPELESCTQAVVVSDTVLVVVSAETAAALSVSNLTLLLSTHDIPYVLVNINDTTSLPLTNFKTPPTSTLARLLFSTVIDFSQKLQVVFGPETTDALFMEFVSVIEVAPSDLVESWDDVEAYFEGRYTQYFPEDCPIYAPPELSSLERKTYAQFHYCKDLGAKLIATTLHAEEATCAVTLTGCLGEGQTYLLSGPKESESVFESVWTVPYSSLLSNVFGNGSLGGRAGSVYSVDIVLRTTVASVFQHTKMEEVRGEFVCNNKPQILHIDYLTAKGASFFSSTYSANVAGQCVLRVTYFNLPVAGTPLDLLFYIPYIDYEACEPSVVKHRILLISAEGSDTDYQRLAAIAFLKQAKLPYQEMKAAYEDVATVLPLAAECYPYDTLILTTSGLSYYDAAIDVWKSAFSQAEWYHIQLYQLETGARRISLLTYPTALLGMLSYSVETPYSSQVLPLHFTEKAFELAPELATLDLTGLNTGGAFMYTARVIDETVTKPLATVTLPEGGEAVVLVEHTFRDGRKEIFSMLDVGAASPHFPAYGKIFAAFHKADFEFSSSLLSEGNLVSGSDCSAEMSISLYRCDGFQIEVVVEVSALQGCEVRLHSAPLLSIDPDSPLVDSGYPGFPVTFSIHDAQPMLLVNFSTIVYGPAAETICLEKATVIRSLITEIAYDIFGVKHHYTYNAREVGWSGLPDTIIVDAVNTNTNETVSSDAVKVHTDRPTEPSHVYVEWPVLVNGLYAVQYTAVKNGTNSSVWLGEGESKVDHFTLNVTGVEVCMDLIPCEGGGFEKSVGMTVLVLCTTCDSAYEPHIHHIIQYLDANHIPYHLFKTIVSNTLNQNLPILTDPETGMPLYYAVIFSSNTLNAAINGAWIATYTGPLQERMDAYISTVKPRVVAMFTYPSPYIGVTQTAMAGAYTLNVKMTNVSAALLQYPLLQDPLSTNGAWTYPAIITSSTTTPFLTIQSSDGTESYVGAAVTSDPVVKQQSLHIFFSTAAWFPNIALLDKLVINWVTGAVVHAQVEAEVGVTPTTPCLTAVKAVVDYCGLLSEGKTRVRIDGPDGCQGQVEEGMGVFKVRKYALPPYFKLNLTEVASNNDDVQYAPAEIGMEMLLVSSGRDAGAEPSLGLIKTFLDTQQIPYDHHVTTDNVTALPVLLGPADFPKYQAIFLTTEKLSAYQDGLYVETLTTELDAHLKEYEKEFGVRRVSFYTYPRSEYGVSATESGSGAVHVLELSPFALSYADPTEDVTGLSTNGGWNYPAEVMAAGYVEPVLIINDTSRNILGFVSHFSAMEQTMHFTTLFASWMPKSGIITQIAVNWATAGVQLRSVGGECAYSASIMSKGGFCVTCVSEVVLYSSGGECTVEVYDLYGTPHLRTVTVSSWEPVVVPLNRLAA